MRVLPVFCVLLFFFSCNAYKELPYLQESETISQEDLRNTATLYDAKIMPKDVLSITVNASTSAASDFNLPLIPYNSKEAVQLSVQASSAASGSLQTYMVENDGTITFPVLGKVHVGGMTKTQAQIYIASLIYPQYLSKNPIVNIRFTNYKVAVLGEVARPGEYSTSNDRISIFEAIAKAGDLTIYGKRDNVLLTRVDEHGMKKIYRINLQDKSLLLNPELYYLQQNDQIYVETNAAKGNSSRFGSFETISMSALSIVISVISIVLR